jgi:flagellar protein FlaF
MHKLQYTELLEDDAKDARERERLAIDRSIGLMEQAESSGAGSVDAAKAIVFTSKLWAVLIEDLAAPSNGLAKELRAQIVSIGIWILREIERIRSGEKTSFADLIQVSRAIREGLL